MQFGDKTYCRAACLPRQAKTVLHTEKPICSIDSSDTMQVDCCVLPR